MSWLAVLYFLVLFIFRADMLQPVYSRGHDMNIPNLEKNFKQVYTHSIYIRTLSS